MVHRFYERSPQRQKAWLWRVGVLIVLCFLALIATAFWLKKWWLFILVYPVFTILTPFVDVPTGKMQGTLLYYSPLFIIQPNTKKKSITLHGGTLFDYLFVLQPFRWGRDQTRAVINSYLGGLHRLIADEKKYSDEWVVRGTSYWLKVETAQRFGFIRVKKDGGQQLILAMNVFQLSVALSYVKGSLFMARVTRANTFEATLGELRRERGKLEQLIRFLA